MDPETDTPAPAPEPEPSPSASGQIIARPGKYYRFTRFIMVAAIFPYGLWNLYDGFVVYPADNAAARRRGLDVLPHAALDIPFNRTLGIALPPLSLLFLAWTLYNSRGRYRLDGDTLYIPGHPALPLQALRTVDRTKWDRKGIAKVEYEEPGTGKIGTFKLDDFVYERPPTDVIFRRIEEFFQPLVAAPETPAAAADPAIEQA